MPAHPEQPGRKWFHPSDDPRLVLGVDEFAKAIGVGRTIIFAEIKAGRLRARKFGKRTLIYDQEGRAWFESLPFAAEVE
jgi:excisionase family DNA binding protein